MNALRISRIAAAAAACLALAAVAMGPKEGKEGKEGYAATAKIGEKAPNFTLTDLNGKEHTLAQYTEQGKVVVLEWFNAVCPYVVKHYRDDTMTMNKLADTYRDKGVVWLRVNSGAPGKQGAGLEYNREIAEKWKMTDPMLLDESGKVGKKYNSKNTPTMCIIDASGTLVYWGAIDNDSSGRKIGDVNYVADAIKQVLAGETVTTATTKPYGCSVKYAD